MNLTVIVSRVLEEMALFIGATIVAFVIVSVLAVVKVAYDLISKWKSQWRSHGKKL